MPRSNISVPRTNIPIPRTVAGTRNLVTGNPPSSISSLRLWLKADAITGLADGASVTTWSDSSGQGNNAIQASTPLKPTYKINIVNGLPVVRFVALSGQHFGFADVFSGFTAGEVFIIVKDNIDPPLAIDVDGLWTFGTSGLRTHFPFSDSVLYDGWGSDTRKTTGDPTLSLASAFRLYNVSSQANEWVSRINGVQHFRTVTNTVGFTATAYLGRSNVTGNSYLDGDIAEIVIFNAVLSSFDRTQIQAYFSSKYNLGLTITSRTAV